MKLRLCVFPSDPVQEYVRKGEIKPRYYNPLDIFDEIHVINPSDDEADVESLKIMAGRAELKIHPIGKSNIINMHAKKNKTIDIVRRINPNAIRSYNQLIQGWLAAMCSKTLKIPLIISLHTDYKEEIEKEYRESGQRLRYYKLFLTRIITQKTSLSVAEYVFVIDKRLIPYANECGAKNVEVIYNRVDFQQFKDAQPALRMDKPIILNVGNFRKIKNQECLIRAVKDLDVYLVLIGKGELLDTMKSLAKELGIEKKVIFIESIEHTKIQNYYASASIFAMPLKGNGVTIPTLEALASECVTVVAEQNREKNEPFDPFIQYVNNEPESFKNAFVDILKNYSSYKKNVQNAREILGKIDKDAMEFKESDIYNKILNINH